METKRKQKGAYDTALPHPSPVDLMGKQSVRATFKLSHNAIKALSIVAVHLGIKRKSLFDHLIENTRSLDLLAGSIQLDKFERLSRIQKTYVLSRKTLSCLDVAAKRHDAPRDALVEYSINRLLPIIQQERKKYGIQKKLLKDMNALVGKGEDIFNKYRSLLGKNDRACGSLAMAVASLIRGRDQIASFVEKGKAIEEY